MKTENKPAHTPGLVRVHNPSKACTCWVDFSEDGRCYCIEYCPMHCAAPAILAAIKELRAAVTDVYKSGRIAAEPFIVAGNVIAAAEGR